MAKENIIIRTVHKREAIAELWEAGFREALSGRGQTFRSPEGCYASIHPMPGYWLAIHEPRDASAIPRVS